MFDNGRLKTANFNTDQGFGLRAVAGEASGYAHSSELSEAALLRASDAVSTVKGGYSGTLAAAPARTNTHLYGDENPIAAPSFAEKAKLLQDIDAWLRARDPRVRQVTASLAASWQHIEILRADGQVVRDIRPLVRVNFSVMVGEGDRQETGSLRHGRAQVLRRIHRRGQLEIRRRGGAAPGAGQSRGDPGAGRHLRHRAVERLAGRHAARGGRPRAGGRLQPQEDLGLRRADGQPGRRQGRHRGRRRHHRRAARLAHRRRRGHADQPHRADRRRQTRRLHAGSPERAADGHGGLPATAGANPTRTSRCRA